MKTRLWMSLVLVGLFGVAIPPIFAENLSASNLDHGAYPTPLKQEKAGISAHKIMCNTGLELIIKYDNSPVCVTPDSAKVLIERNFGHKIDNKQVQSTEQSARHLQADITVYDNMMGKKSFEGYPGMQDIVLLTGGYFWNSTSHYQNASKIDWELLESRLHNIAKVTPLRPVVLDIEGTDNEEPGRFHWSVDQRRIGTDFTKEQYDEYKQHWIEIIGFVKDNYPGEVGVYALAPIRDFFTPVRNIPSELESWHLANSALREVVEHADFVVPSLYTFYDEPNHGGNTKDARSKWVTYAQKNIHEAEQYGKPTYVYLSGYFHPSNDVLGGKPISKEFMKLQYETVMHQDIQHIVIWGKSSYITESDPLDEPWYQALQDIGLVTNQNQIH